MSGGGASEVSLAVSVPSSANASSGGQNARRTSPGPSPLLMGLSSGGIQVSSRYDREFAELRRLGRGGQGTVFVVENVLDGIEYAVKKVLLPKKENERDRVLREVKSLARLDHVNIVRYYQAWIEQMAGSDARAALAGLRSPKNGASSASGHGGVFSTSGFSLTSVTSDYSETASEADEGEEADREVLFIQMKLCQDKTLEKYLEPTGRTDVRENKKDQPAFRSP